MTSGMRSKKPPAFSGIEKLSAAHDLSAFDSGKPPLDEWLRKYALVNQKSDGAQTYVVHHALRVLGYYSLAAGSIATPKASKRAAAGQPQKGSVPVIVLARLAVDTEAQGQGIGAALLKDALLRSAQAADTIGARAVLVHALDADALLFYQHFGFESSPVDEMTLMLLMKDIRGNMS